MRIKVYILRLFFLLALSAFFLGGLLPAHAAQRAGPEQAKPLVTEILAHEDFATGHEETFWRAIPQDRKSEVDWDLDFLVGFFKFLGEFLAQISELLLWLAGAGVAYFLVRFALARFGGWRDLLPGRGVAPQAPDSVLESQDSRQPLRGDIAAQARELWEQGRILAALALLYRGSLEALHRRYQLDFSSGNSEGECLVLVRRGVDEPGVREYFAELTRHWQYAAYAHRLPAQEAGPRLCGEWRRHFGESL